MSFVACRTEKLTAERRAAEAEIQERLRKFQIVDPELLVVDDFEDVVEEPEFIELTQEQRARINAAICGPPDQVCKGLLFTFQAFFSHYNGLLFIGSVC